MYLDVPICHVVARKGSKRKEYQETKAKFAFVKFMPLLAPLLWGFTVTQQCTDRQAD